MVEFPTDELLNDPKEWHSLVAGLFQGFVRLRPGKIPADFKQDSHYYKAGFIIGFLLKLGLVVYFGPQVAGIAIASM